MVVSCLEWVQAPDFGPLKDAGGCELLEWVQASDFGPLKVQQALSPGEISPQPSYLTVHAKVNLDH